MTQKVTGPALLQLADQYGDRSKAELCRAAGYIAFDKEGKARPDYPTLQNAILAAHGHSFAKTVLRPRAADYRLTVTKAGLVTIGKAYLSRVGATEGQVFKIEVNGKSLHLTPIDEADAAPADHSAWDSSPAL